MQVLRKKPPKHYNNLEASPALSEAGSSIQGDDNSVAGDSFIRGTASEPGNFSRSNGRKIPEPIFTSLRSSPVVSSQDPPPFVRKHSPVVTYVIETLEAGSVQGSAGTLLISMVGVGTLAQPYCLKTIGLAVGLVGLVLFTFFAIFSLETVVLCTTLAKTYSYREIAIKSFETKRAGDITSAILIIHLVLANVAYMLVVRTMATAALGILIDDDEGLITNEQSIYFLVGVMFVVALPLSMLKNMKSLGYSSQVGLVCFIYLVTITVYKYFQYCGRDAQATPCMNDGLFKEVPYAQVSLVTLIEVVPIWMGIYASHPAALPTYRDLSNPSPSKMNTVIYRGVGMAFGIYLVAGIFGYFTFLDEVEGNYLLNIYNHDYEVSIGAIALSLSLTLAVPVLTNAARKNVELLFFGVKTSADGGPSSDKDEQMSDVASELDLNEPLHSTNSSSEPWPEDSWKFRARSMLISTVIVGTGVIFASIFNDLTQVLEAIGSTTVPVICFIQPVYFLYKLNKKSPDDKLKWNIRIGILIAVLVSFSSIGTLIYIIGFKYV